VVTKRRHNVLARDDTSEWYATAHDGPDSELARLQRDGPGFMLDVGSSTGLGTSMTNRSGKGDRLARAQTRPTSTGREPRSLMDKPRSTPSRPVHKIDRDRRRPQP
jgi:hypothetical protein